MKASFRSKFKLNLDLISRQTDIVKSKIRLNLQRGQTHDNKEFVPIRPLEESLQ